MFWTTSADEISAAAAAASMSSCVIWRSSPCRSFGSPHPQLRHIALFLLEDDQQQDDDHDQGQQSAADIDSATAVAHDPLLVRQVVDHVIDRILGVGQALLRLA